jgi:hypothetical protein
VTDVHKERPSQNTFNMAEHHAAYHVTFNRKSIENEDFSRRHSIMRLASRSVRGGLILTEGKSGDDSIRCWFIFARALFVYLARRIKCQLAAP